MFVVDLDPILLRLGPVQISWTGFFVALGIVVSVLLGEIQFRGRGFAPGLGFDIAIVVLPAGFAGARLFHVADHWSFYSVHPLQAFTTGGESLDGAVVAGSIAALYYLRRRQLSPWAPLDAIVGAALVGLALGSVGSFLAGDVSGRAAAFGPSVTYPHLPQSASMQTGMYPVELYEASLYVLAFVFLTRLRPATARPGAMFGAFLFVTGVDQFGLGFLRDQPVDFFSLGQAQIVGAVLVIVGMLVLASVAPAWNRGWRSSG